MQPSGVLQASSCRSLVFAGFDLPAGQCPHVDACERPRGALIIIYAEFHAVTIAEVELRSAKG